MASNTNNNPIEYMDIKTIEDASQMLNQMYECVQKLGDRVQKVFKDMAKTLQQRLWAQARNWIVSVMQAFKVDSLADYTEAAAIYGTELSATLYQLQQSFAGVKTAVIQALAPLVQVAVPVIQTVTHLLTGLLQVVGRVVRLLFLGTTEAEDFAAGMTGAATSSKKLQKSLAGFDQITRLGSKDSIGSSISGLVPVSNSWKTLAAKLDKLLEPLKNLDLTPAAESLERLRKALEPITKALFAGLEWAWYNLLVPLAQWAVEELLPVFLDTLAAALQALGRVIEELKPYFTWLWEECLKPLALWKGNQIITYLQDIGKELSGVSGWLNITQSPVERFTEASKLLIQALGQMAQNTVTVGEASDGAFNALSAFLSILNVSNTPLEGTVSTFGMITQAVGSLASAFDLVTDSSNGAWWAMSNIWENGWQNLSQKFVDPSYAGVKQSMNRTIDLMNSMLMASTDSVNYLGKAMNSLSYTVPSWVPGIGGKSFSFFIKTLQAPQIPYLAKGAVLPANKPFMAVVGDQKHGTNVEAPLTVIQEAVSAVMQDYIDANMAGQQQVVSVLRQLLAAVMGISIGDDVIAGAVARYEGKMAVVRGGIL